MPLDVVGPLTMLQTATSPLCCDDNTTNRCFTSGIVHGLKHACSTYRILRDQSLRQCIQTVLFGSDSAVSRMGLLSSRAALS